MIKLFGSNYEEFGSSETNLILKTKGKIKIQWGNKFIDLLDNNGNVGGAKTSDLIKKVSSTELITEDGIYFQSSSKSESTIPTNIGPVSSSRRAAAVVASVDGEQIDLTKQSDWNQSDSSLIDFIRNKPTKLSDFINDVGFLTSHQSLTQYALKSELPLFTQVQADWDLTDSSSPDYIKNKPSLTISGGGNEISLEGYATETWVGLLGFLTSSDLSTYALKSELFSGSYSDLTNKPTLFSGNYNDLSNKPSLFSGNYNDLTNKPTIPSLTGYATETWVENKGYLTSHLSLSDYALKSELFSGSYNDLTNKPTLFSGSYTDLSNKPTIPDNTVYVDLSSALNITGVKTFVGLKKILFKQSSSSDKLGFTLYNNSDKEVGFLEYRTNGIGSYPILTLGNYYNVSTIKLTYVGFRCYDNINSALYNLVAPLAKDIKSDFSLTTTATNFYIPLSFTNGTVSVVSNDHGIVNISSLITSQQLSDWSLSDTNAVDYIKNKPTIPTIPTNVSSFINDAGYLTSHQSLSGYVQTSNTSGLIKNDGTIDTSTYGKIWTGTLALYEALSPNYDANTMYVINDPNNSPVIPLIWLGTQALYNALSPNYDNNTIYIITES